MAAPFVVGDGGRGRRCARPRLSGPDPHAAASTPSVDAETSEA